VPVVGDIAHCAIGRVCILELEEPGRLGIVVVLLDTGVGVVVAQVGIVRFGMKRIGVRIGIGIVPGLGAGIHGVEVVAVVAKGIEGGIAIRTRSSHLCCRRRNCRCRYGKHNPSLAGWQGCIAVPVCLGWRCCRFVRSIEDPEYWG
jgi:hypothetical protein